MTGIDYTVTDHGSVLLLKGITPECELWIEENVGDDDTQVWAGALVIEPRFVGPIIEGLQSEGFVGLNPSFRG